VGSRADVSVVAGALRAFLDILAGHCRDLPADALTSLDRVVERKLWEIDRADVQAVTGGSDGDVRSGSVKRAAAAIGEGSMAVRLVFDRLQAAGIADAIELGTGSPRA